MSARVVAEPLDGPSGRALLAELDADLAARYGDDEPVVASPQQFLPPHGLFLVAYGTEEADQALGCGGFRQLSDGVAELKRMYVRPAARGRGLARHLLEHLEKAARDAGYEQLWLETGLSQPEAMALYTTAGYAAIPAFGQFAWAPSCRCYGKDLTGSNRNSRAPLS